MLGRHPPGSPRACPRSPKGATGDRATKGVDGATSGVLTRPERGRPRTRTRGTWGGAKAYLWLRFLGTMTWPQSGERFRGRENALGALSIQDDVPTPVGEPRIVGSGDTWVVMMPLQYAEAGAVHYIGVFELRDGRIRASTEYFGSPFPAKPERARFTEQS